MSYIKINYFTKAPLLISAFILFSFSVISPQVFAARRAQKKGRVTSLTHAKNHPLSLGVVLGSPTGFTGKYWLSRERAVDAGLGWSGGSVTVWSDYLWHFHDFARFERKPLDYYYGVGARIHDKKDDFHFGIRIPFGVRYGFRDPRFEVFAELAPIFNIAPDAKFNLNFGIGIRYSI